MAIWPILEFYSAGVNVSRKNGTNKMEEVHEMRRNNRSKFLALFLSLAFTIQLLPAAALAAEGTGDPLVKETGYTGTGL